MTNKLCNTVKLADSKKYSDICHPIIEQTVTKVNKSMVIDLKHTHCFLFPFKSSLVAGIAFLFHILGVV